MTTTTQLRFDGSLWCNLDIALRSIDSTYRRLIRPTNLTVIEWYVLRALFERDGQHASELARAVGRAATSFTPNLDKLQGNGYIERRPDETDRRAVRIFLTDKAKQCKADVMESAEEIDTQIQQAFSGAEIDTLHRVLAHLQEHTLE